MPRARLLTLTFTRKGEYRLSYAGKVQHKAALACDARAFARGWNGDGTSHVWIPLQNTEATRPAGSRRGCVEL